MREDGSPPPGTAATVVLTFPAVLRREAVAELCARLDALLRASPGAVVTLDATPVVRPDAVVVEAIARLTLTARRHHRPVQVDAPDTVLDLLDLTGIAALVGRPAPTAGPLPAAEREREPPGRR